MLRQFGATNCPRCTTQLVHEDDLANDWVLPAEQRGADQRWLCPGCGYSRPVTYFVERTALQTQAREPFPQTLKFSA